MAVSSIPFTRTRTTWLGYVLLTYHTMLQALVSAVVPFLRAELELNYSQASLYMSFNATGMVLAGVTGRWLADRFGRRVVLWGAACGSMLGLLALIFGRHNWITLAGAFTCGLCGSLCMVIVQAILADEHGSRRSVALSEANVTAGMGSFIAPLLASGAVVVGLGWRAAPVVALGLVILAIALFWRAPVPTSRAAGADHRPSPRLPASFWLMLGVIFLSVSVEWSVIFWSADFLEKIAGFARAASVSMMGVYFAAAVIGRFAASRLLRRVAPLRLLFAAMALAALSLLLVWQAPWQPARVLGLFGAGLSIGNLFPLGMIQAMSAVPQAANQASGLTTLATGLAIFSAPLTLGLVADLSGIRWAYGLALLLLAGAVLLALLALYRKRRSG